MRLREPATSGERRAAEPPSPGLHVRHTRFARNEWRLAQTLQETFSFTGSQPAGQGEANSVLIGNRTSAGGYTLGNLILSGSFDQIHAADFASENRFIISSPGGATFTIQPTEVTGYSGTFSFSNIIVSNIHEHRSDGTVDVPVLQQLRQRKRLTCRRYADVIHRRILQPGRQPADDHSGLRRVERDGGGIRT